MTEQLFNHGLLKWKSLYVDLEEADHFATISHIKNICRLLECTFSPLLPTICNLYMRTNCWQMSICSKGLHFTSRRGSQWVQFGIEHFDKETFWYATKLPALLFVVRQLSLPSHSPPAPAMDFAFVYKMQPPSKRVDLLQGAEWTAQ